MDECIRFGRHIYRPAPAGTGLWSLRLSDGEPLCMPIEELAAQAARRGIPPRCDYLDYTATAAFRREAGQPLPHMMVSACLAGERCRYDGGDHLVPAARTLVETGEALPVCPECSGGLPCPRTPCERRGNGVFGKDGSDCTAAFAEGARRCLEAARIFPIETALLKARSPSCGVDEIYDGTFSHRCIPGSGVFAEQLAAAGIRLATEQTYHF